MSFCMTHKFSNLLASETDLIFIIANVQIRVAGSLACVRACFNPNGLTSSTHRSSVTQLAYERECYLRCSNKYDNASDVSVRMRDVYIFMK